jgi:glycosidase
MSAQWIKDAVIYHIYPLGALAAEEKNDFSSQPKSRIGSLGQWIPHLKRLSVNTVLFGPIWESSGHGYDTADLFTVDRRLGTNDDVKALFRTFHEAGIRVIIDSVFHHTGRDFFAFRDMREKREGSRFSGWYSGVDFSRRSPFGDPFSYDGFKGCYDLAKLNLHNSEVRDHLFAAVRLWIEEFGIDGMRIDAADCVDANFLSDLSSFCRNLKHDFWMLGEVVHGDYRSWANERMLDSVTNYECYKGLWSSLNDKNYFEIAYALNRQFGQGGLYRGLLLYSFADNHDVDRVSSSLKEARHLYPLYLLLFAMPGIPSIYYGSEVGVLGKKRPDTDRDLRPALNSASLWETAPHRDLLPSIERFAAIRSSSEALKTGSYQELLVRSEQFAFLRRSDGESLVVILNADTEKTEVSFPLPLSGVSAYDILNNEGVEIHGGQLSCSLYPSWGRIIRLA